jgi:hypothetical protein
MIQNGLRMPISVLPKIVNSLKVRNGSPKILVLYNDVNATPDTKLFISYLKNYIKNTSYLVDFSHSPNNSELPNVLKCKYNANYRCFILLSVGSANLLNYCVPFFRNNRDTICFSTFSTFNFEPGVLPFNVIRTSVNDQDLVRYICKDILYKFRELAGPSNIYDAYQNLPISTGYSLTGEALPVFNKIVYIYTESDAIGNPDIYSSGYLDGLMQAISPDPNITIETFLITNDNFTLSDLAVQRLTENPVSSDSYISNSKTIFFINSITPNKILSLLTSEDMYDNYFMLSDSYASVAITSPFPIKHGIMPIGNFSFAGYKFAGLIASPTGYSISPQILSVVDLIVDMSPIYAKYMSERQTIETIKIFKSKLEELKFIVDKNYWFERKIFTYFSTSVLVNGFNTLMSKYIFFQFKFNPLTSGTFISPDEVTTVISNDVLDVYAKDLYTFQNESYVRYVFATIGSTDRFILMMGSELEYNNFVDELNVSVGGSRLNRFVRGNQRHTPMMFEMWNSHDPRFVPARLSCTIDLLVFANVRTVHTIIANIPMTQYTFDTWGEKWSIDTHPGVQTGNVNFSINIETDPLSPEELTNGITYVQYFSGHIYKGHGSVNGYTSDHSSFAYPKLTRNQHSTDGRVYNFGDARNVTGYWVHHMYAKAPHDTNFLGNIRIAIGPNGENDTYPLGDQCAIIGTRGYVFLRQGVNLSETVISFWACGVDSSNISTVGDLTQLYIQYHDVDDATYYANPIFSFRAPVGKWTRYDVRIGPINMFYKWGFKSAYYNPNVAESKLKTAIQVIDGPVHGHGDNVGGDYLSPVIVNIKINQTVVYNSFKVGDYIWCVPKDFSTPYPGQVTAITANFQTITVQRHEVDTNQPNEPLFYYFKKVYDGIANIFGQSDTFPLRTIKSGTLILTDMWGNFVSNVSLSIAGLTSLISNDITSVGIDGNSLNPSTTPFFNGIENIFALNFASGLEYNEWISKCTNEKSTANKHTQFFWELCRSNKLPPLVVNINATIGTTSTPTSYVVSQNVNFTSTKYTNSVGMTINRTMDIYFNTPLITSSTTDIMHHLVYYSGNEYVSPNTWNPSLANDYFKAVTNNYWSPILFMVTVVKPEEAPTLSNSGSDTPAQSVINSLGATGAIGSNGTISSTGATGATGRTWQMNGASGVYWTQTGATGATAPQWVIHVPSGVIAPESMSGATLVMSGPAMPIKTWGATGWS